MASLLSVYCRFLLLIFPLYLKFVVVQLLDQELISCRYTHLVLRLVVVLIVGATSSKIRLRHFKSDWDEIWQEWSLIFELSSHFK